MTETERVVINGLQGGFPICERPFLEAAEKLGLGEEELIGVIEGLLDQGLLSRFGPLYHAERLGGALSLAAMKVPEAEFDAIAERVNAFPEVAHNYARDHALNMWFVLATETVERHRAVLREIEAATGLNVYDMPKITEYFVGLHFVV
ncbi:Lrp/AsnC family transcriptional regulator [Methylotetracoccus oryzae]|uniref:Lrp/AsnC family transcriptional regulator n=1 Tax=Methylotetracoccus oryzae TaxID=1919059 RepID=UPI001118AD74|nr:Lrp/AsnC family transcriptional regulator [Methylotetracoccus oryzae]